MRVLPAFLAAGLLTVGCNESQGPTGVPTAPRTPAIVATPALPGVPTTATTIQVGQTVSGTVTLSDAPCDTDVMSDAPDPCVRYAVVPSQSGFLRVHVVSAGPSWLALWIANASRSYGVHVVDGRVAVTAGNAYHVSVALHQAIGNRTSQSFELTTSIVP